METEVTVSSANIVSSPTPPGQAKLAAKQRDSKKTPSSTPAFLSNLGRATLRGIRRCPQCGVYNGTRGLSCKNKACGVSLRNQSTVKSKVLLAEQLPPVRSRWKQRTLISKPRSSAWMNPPLTVLYLLPKSDVCCLFSLVLHNVPSVFISCRCAASSAASNSAAGKEGLSASTRKGGQRRAPGGGGPKALGCSQVVDECAVTLGFHQWLAGVTERIHQTMHYQCDGKQGATVFHLEDGFVLHEHKVARSDSVFWFLSVISCWVRSLTPVLLLHRSLLFPSGKPQPLVYHIPQEFFNALQHRLSLGSKKRRLPNFTTAFVRNHGPPLGSFSKYTWHFTNPMQVKRIFDTPELPLELSQSFVRNSDGSYSHFRCPDPPPEPEVPEGCRPDRPLAIRPMELRTFLKVGPGPADQKGAGPFVIEWIPDVLPRCRMGELRISFEFGHQQSGQPENSEKLSAAEKGCRTKTNPPQSKPAAGVEIVQVVV